MMENTPKKVTGAVLVQGGGVAGVQAALDLADAGYRVHLVERSAAIGGMMSHLDKTFPTGDCATCIISPKLVECARHQNIDIHTLSELGSIKGQPGDLSVVVKKHPRYVIEKNCVDCGLCVDVCPVALPDAFNRGLGERKAIGKLYAQAVPNKAEIKKLGHAPCVSACPTGINVQGYVQLIKKKAFGKAAQLMRKANPLASICGRTCTHPCEQACTRASVDAAVAIKDLKRFAMDWELKAVQEGMLSLPAALTPKPDALKVAIVGAGPAGLTAASELAEKGYAVTLYESSDKAGGKLRYIPEFRLPSAVLDHDIAWIRQKGVTFAFNTRVGQEITFDSLKEDFQAVLITTGVQIASDSRLEGQELDGIMDSMDFLRSAKAASPDFKVPDRVAVIGGGETALDAARTAVRLGAKEVKLLYPPQENEFKVKIDTATCIGCGQCVPRCPVSALGLETSAQANNKTGKLAVLDTERCIGCGFCTHKCPGNSLALDSHDIFSDASIDPLARFGALLKNKSGKGATPIETQLVEAAEEGITFHLFCEPRAFVGNGSQKVDRIKAAVISPQGAEELLDIATDLVVMPLAQDKTPSFVNLEGTGRIETDAWGRTSMETVFACGDATQPNAPVINVIAAAKKTAQAMDHFLSGTEGKISPFASHITPMDKTLLPNPAATPRIKPSRIAKTAPRDRITHFEESSAGLTETSAIAEAERCLNCALCSECGECAAACKTNAIDYTMSATREKMNVGAVILAPGFAEFAAESKGEFGFGRYANVITTVQFERMLSASGPFSGHVKRLSDGQPVQRMAFIQCVGSRDAACGNAYCSSVCCMAATKQAMIAKEHVAGLEVTIFYMDIRAHGKDFDLFYERARSDGAIDFIKSIPSRVIETPVTKALNVDFVNENGGLDRRSFDLVVLAVGMDPKPRITDAMAKLGIAVNAFGFAETDRMTPFQTSLPGVFVAGAFQEPKDIPETVTQASGAAAQAMELLGSSRHTLVTAKTYPQENDITDESPRIGVFVCHCGINIASVVEVQKVVDAVKDLPDVVLAETNVYACSDSSLSDIKAKIRTHRLNRIVVASCTPRTHEGLFRDTIREAGLNPYLFELANIRDQCSWVHSQAKEEATTKAIDLVKLSIARSRFLSSLEGETLQVDQSALVMGGGMSGMTAALSLADQGFKVSLVEREERLGGNMNTIAGTFDIPSVQATLAQKIKEVQTHPQIDLYMNAKVSHVAGHIGNFTVSLAKKDMPDGIDVKCGGIIVATGAGPRSTTAFHHGDSPKIKTQQAFAAHLKKNGLTRLGQNVVMIQCVDSRNAESPYCSRVCCGMAIKNALDIKKIDKTTNVFILYRDIRTYGFREIEYQEAREKGVVFIRYTPEEPPVVDLDGGLQVTLKSPDYKEPLAIETDLLVLSTGIKAEPDNARISNLLKVPLNADGFYVEAHVKLRPVDFASEGIFLCGLSHSPKYLDENIAQAKAAASRVATILAKDRLTAGAQVSYVDQQKCISCMTCLKACPYHAPFVNKDQKAQIATAKCMGCGICASECPARAIRLSHFRSEQFEAMIDELFN